MTVVLSVIGGGIGMFGGHFVYDSAKLLRREMRRQRKLNSELTVKHEVSN